MFEKISKYLDPSDRLSEIMFGLIMTMTVASSTKLAAGKDCFAQESLFLQSQLCLADDRGGTLGNTEFLKQLPK
jgi:hypothetical protein